LLARAVASQLDCNFLKVVSSAIVDKYIGESARMIREMFAYAKDHQPCIIFMDEIDAIGNDLLFSKVVFNLIYFNRWTSIFGRYIC
jgi:ATP-dependent 26S proteasome regulatory subunit